MWPPGPISVSAGNSSRTTTTTGGRRSARCLAPAPSWASAKVTAPATSSPSNARRTRGNVKPRLRPAQQPQSLGGPDLEHLDRVPARVQRRLGHHEREVLGRVAGEVEGAPDGRYAAVDRHRQVARGRRATAAEVA